MKNKNIFVVITFSLLLSVLGCSWWNPLASKPESNRSNTATKDNKASPAPKEKTLEDKAIDTVVGEEKIGIPECDELVDSIAKESESQDDGYGAKAIRGYFMNKIRESVRKSIEENKNEPAKLAKECKEFKEQLDKYKAEEEKKTP
jgi:hypothetical protein